MITTSAATLSLFAEPTNPPKRPSSLVLSILLHAAVAGVVYYGITHLPRIIGRPLLEHESVQRIDMPTLDPNFPQMPDFDRAENNIQELSADAIRQFSPVPSPKLSEEMRSFLGQLAGPPPTIQPEIHPRPSFTTQTAQPNIMASTPAAILQKRFIALANDVDAAPEIEPLPGAPNQAIRTADIAVPPRELPPTGEPVPGGTALPFQGGLARTPKTAGAGTVPSLESPASAAPSISELRLPDERLLRPPVNEIAVANPAAENLTAAAFPAVDVNVPLRAENPKRQDVADVATDGRQLSSEHIVLPKDGKFSVVAVGSSLEEEYPQTADIWADRVAYTAYLHVGLRKSWILQYSATQAADMAAAGRVERLDAPWPYDIVRPNLVSQDIHSGALMVHGVLNQAGRLESLAVAFPNRFRYASFVLGALSQWQFRPALENGEATPVEVLLIIPEEMD